MIYPTVQRTAAFAFMALMVCTCHAKLHARDYQVEEVNVGSYVRKMASTASRKLTRKVLQEKKLAMMTKFRHLQSPDESDDSPVAPPVEVSPDSSPAVAPVEVSPDSSPAVAPVEVSPDSSPAVAPVEVSPDSSPAVAPVDVSPDSSPAAPPSLAGDSEDGSPAVAPVDVSPDSSPAAAPSLAGDSEDGDDRRRTADKMPK